MLALRTDTKQICQYRCMPPATATAPATLWRPAAATLAGIASTINDFFFGERKACLWVVFTASKLGAHELCPRAIMIALPSLALVLAARSSTSAKVVGYV
jgi:hypothetical protein